MFQIIDARIWVFPHSILPLHLWWGKNIEMDQLISLTTTTMMKSGHTIPHGNGLGNGPIIQHQCAF